MISAPAAATPKECSARTSSGARARTCVEIKIYGAFVLNQRVVLHAIFMIPARRRGGSQSHLEGRGDLDAVRIGPNFDQRPPIASSPGDESTQWRGITRRAPQAHQLVMEGYKPLFDETLVTVWSAPNYCYRCGNVAAILELDGELARTYRIFEAAPQESRGVPQKSPAPEYFL